MSLRHLPALKAFQAQDGLSFDVPKHAKARWSGDMQAAKTDDSVINIYDQIGDDGYGGGTNVKRISAALRSIGEKDVILSMNSPGGDFFEGIAIYNLLRDHPKKVTVKIVGLAASAASVIAMAGDEIQIARTGFLMIHNAWVVTMGNRHDLRAAADVIEPFDAAMAGLYAERTGIDYKKITKMMDQESWITGADAVEQGFADALLNSDEIPDKAVSALRKLDNALAKSGMPRSERRALIKEISGTQAAAIASLTPSAEDKTSDLLAQLVQTLKL